MKLLSVTRRATSAILIPLTGVTLALGTVAILLQLTGANVGSAFTAMAQAAFGGTFALSITVTKTMPRLFAALGIAIGLRAGLWNIGAEGQIYLGAIAATAVALYGPNLGLLTIVLAVLAAALAGAVWASIPGVMRATRGINEVITSLMLVYVAIQFTNYLCEGPWLPPGSTFAASRPIPANLRLPSLADNTLLSAGAIVALCAVPLVWFVISRTPFGLRLRALGGSPEAAFFAGVNVRRMIILAMVASGALAGLGGGIEILGVRGRLIEGFSPGYGFEAIAIALLGRLHPLGILGAAVLFGALDAGGAGLQTAARGVSSAIVPISGGLAVMYVLIGLGIEERLNKRRRARAALLKVETPFPSNPLRGNEGPGEVEHG